MPQKSVFTTITPLPLSISREAAIAWIHDHTQMIQLNPLVIRHSVTEPPLDATAEELSRCVWYAITDKIKYMPGLPAKGEVTYKAAFYDLPNGLQTHVFAPGGVDIRGLWSIGGNLPGEPREPLELGSELPRDRLFLREHVVLRCNIFFTAFVKKNLKKSHAVLVQRLLCEAVADEQRLTSLVDARHELKHRRSASAATSYNLERDTGHGTAPCECDGGVHQRACRYYPGLVSVAGRMQHTSRDGSRSGEIEHGSRLGVPNIIHARRSFDRAELEDTSSWPQDQHELPVELYGARRYSETDI